MKLGCRIVTVLSFAALSVPAAAQQAVGTELTYQGQLKDSGAVLNGSADFQFSLWNADTGGSQVGSTLAAGDVNVVGGLFTVDLDFGANAFTGDALWLEIAVRSPHDPTDTGPFTTLDPRQPLTAAPYAVHALNAGQWQSSGSAIMNANTGFVGINRDYTVGSEWFGVHAPINSGYGGMYLTTEGATARPFYGYSTGTQSGWHYLDGVTGDWHVYLDGTRMTVTDEGNVGIGATSPAHRLHVAGSSADRIIYGENSNTGGTGVRGFGGTGVWGESSSSNGRGVFGNATGSAIYGVYGSVVSASGYAGYFTGGRSYFEGSVGVGTTSPSHKLHVSTNGSENGVHGENGGAGAGVFGHQTATTGIRTGAGGRSDSNAGRGVFGWATASTGNTYGVHGQSDSNAGRGVFGLATSSSGTTYGVRAQVNSASGYAGYFEGPVGSQNYFERSVGIGTTSPANSLSVVGGADITGPVSIGITGADARLLVRGVTGEDAFRVRVDSSTKLLVKDNGGVGIGSNFSSVPANGLRTAGSVGIGADPGSFTLVSNGDAAKPGGGLWSTFCDARLKRDIQPIAPGALERLLSLRGWTFEYVEDAIANRFGLPGRQTGLIAQEVEAVFPEWVDADDEGYLYVTERGLTAIVVEAFRELRAEKDAAIETLRADNDALRQRVERMEAALSRLTEQRAKGERGSARK